MSWKQELLRPITVPETGKILKTLSDVRAYLLALPTERHREEAVETACEALLLAAEGKGPVLHASAAIGKIINGSIEIPEPMERSPNQRFRTKKKDPWT